MRPWIGALLLAGCAVRPAPYRFAGPVVGSVSLDELPAPLVTEAPAQTDEPDDGEAPADPARDPAALAGPDLPGPSSTEAPAARIDTEAFALAEEAPVGRRDDRTPLAFALALAGLDLPVADGPALVTLARERGALAPPNDPVEPGDLLIFDRAVEGAPASLIAVVRARDDRGVVEMIYLAAGVVRRGFVDPARPAVKRDDEGKVVNTFLRHNRDQPPEGTRFLAGELLAHIIHKPAL